MTHARSLTKQDGPCFTTIELGKLKIERKQWRTFTVYSNSYEKSTNRNKSNFQDWTKQYQQWKVWVDWVFQLPQAKDRAEGLCPPPHASALRKHNESVGRGCGAECRAASLLALASVHFQPPLAVGLPPHRRQDGRGSELRRSKCPRMPRDRMAARTLAKPQSVSSPVAIEQPFSVRRVRK